MVKASKGGHKYRNHRTVQSTSCFCSRHHTSYSLLRSALLEIARTRTSRLHKQASLTSRSLVPYQLTSSLFVFSRFRTPCKTRQISSASWTYSGCMLLEHSEVCKRAVTGGNSTRTKSPQIYILRWQLSFSRPLGSALW